MKGIQTITETKTVTEQVVVRQRQNECRESVNDGDNECDNACETVSDSYRDKYSDMIDIVKVSETLKVGETDLVRVKDNHRDSQEVTVPLTLQ